MRTVHPIEAQSYRLLRQAVDTTHLPRRTRDVVERIVHTTADPSWLSDLVTDEAALEAGAVALAAGAPLVVDAAMVGAGITRYPSVCLVAAPETARLAEERGLTRSAAGIRLAATQAGGATTAPTGGASTADGAVGDGAVRDGAASDGAVRDGAVRDGAVSDGAVCDGAVWAVGNAPTALAELLRLAEAGIVRPALVIGVPVGYVGAAEAKAALRATGLPSLTNRSARGGSAIAAAAVNALLYGDPLS
ncbi:precorrin-8X methylmutase [Rugosimonospora africana]|uniref:precorrin-8X methylmutase n=1 Tax=Rugosimonospora africana TaxID=556532 RepID=UPI00194470CC|nr:precorrin-8X methylmutase [Rugosimonospora africana]